MCGDLDRAKILGRTGIAKCSEVMATVTMTADLARDAFMSRDYRLACELFEQVLREEVPESTSEVAGESSQSKSQRLSLYYGYADSLARAGRLKDALDVFGHISGVLESGLIPLDRLRHLTSSLVETVLATRHTLPKSTSNPSVDPLCCPICEDILRFPVTATCGHTFCRQCCFGHSSCTVCHTQFPTIPSSPGPSSTVTTQLSLPATVTSSSSSSLLSEEPIAGSSSSAVSGSGSVSSGKRDSVIGFEQDILIRRLVERWWGPELKAAELNEEAQRYLDDGGGPGGGGDGGHQGLDEALRCCNQSLENELKSTP